MLLAPGIYACVWIGVSVKNCYTGFWFYFGDTWLMPVSPTIGVWGHPWFPAHFPFVTLNPLVGPIVIIVFDAVANPILIARVPVGYAFAVFNEFIIHM